MVCEHDLLAPQVLLYEPGRRHEQLRRSRRGRQSWLLLHLSCAYWKDHPSQVTYVFLQNYINDVEYAQQPEPLAEPSPGTASKKSKGKSKGRGKLAQRGYVLRCPCTRFDYDKQASVLPVSCMHDLVLRQYLTELSWPNAGAEAVHLH